MLQQLINYWFSLSSLKFLISRTDEERQQRMLYSAKMESLSEMAGGIAHEINNPLAIGTLLTEKMLKMLNAKNYDEVAWKASLEKMQASLLRINSVVRCLGSYARVSSPSHLEDVPLQETFAAAFAAVDEKLRKSNVEIKTRVGANCLVRALGPQLAEAMRNLISNSLDAVESLPERWITIDCQVQSGDELWIHIRDSGPGIAAEIKDKIMQPFFTTKPVGLGSGLGLPMAKGIIEMFGGRLILNEAAKNTEFIVVLKRSVPARAFEIAGNC